MLGISFAEVMIIAVIGLIVIGPKRLPETARFLGHLFGRIQRQVRAVKNDIRREMDLEEVKNIHREYQQASRDVNSIFNQAASGASAAVKEVEAATVADKPSAAPAQSKVGQAQTSAAAGGATIAAGGADKKTPAAPDNKPAAQAGVEDKSNSALAQSKVGQAQTSAAEPATPPWPNPSVPQPAAEEKISSAPAQSKSSAAADAAPSPPADTNKAAAMAA